MRPLHFILLLAMAPDLSGQSVRLTLDPRSKLTILGTSNIHKWDCSSSGLQAVIEAPRAPAASVGKEVTRAKVTIPVKSLECGEKKMNDNMRKAMNEPAHPNVEFDMTSYVATASPKGADAFEAVIKGSLTINGVTKPVEIKATVSPDGSGGVRVVGSTELRTPDYGVAPVKALLGTIRTGEVVTIVLSLIATQP